MTQMKKAKKFTFIVLSLFFIIPVFYISTYHFIGIKEIKISHSFRHFLLQHTKGPRLIIESGSNSIHSIEAYTLEKEFNIQTIVVSDNAGYPLSKKLQRLKKYANKQDIILLPLEFQYYSRKKTHDVFRNNLLGSLNFYYNFDSMTNELKQIINTPLVNFLKNTRKKYRYYKRQDVYLDADITNFLNLDRGSSLVEKPFDKKIKKTCDQYVLEEQLKNGFKLSSSFKKNIETIKKLKKQGYKIFLTWPVVVGDDCFSKKHKLENFIVDIKNYLKENNILMIGDPYENKFPTKFTSDTYYHVNFEAKKIRTQKLIENIKKSSIYQYMSKNSKTSYLDNIKASKQNIINLLDKEHIKNEKIGFKDSRVLYQNWSKPEKKFRWSKGTNSKLIFKLNPNGVKGLLHLHVKTLGKQKVELSINEKFIKSTTVNSDDIKITFRFNPQILSATNTISFYFPNAHQPNDKDKRILAVALKSFKVE